MKRKAQLLAAAGRTTGRARALATAVSLIVAMSLTACGGDSSGPAGPTTYKTPAGSYDVSTLNAKALPVAIFSDTAYTYERMSGSIVLTADGKYSLKMTSRQTVAGKVDLFVDSTGGTWILAGSTVNFTDAADGSTDHADWSNLGTLTFVEPEGKANNTYIFTIRK